MNPSKSLQIDAKLVGLVLLILAALTTLLALAVIVLLIGVVGAGQGGSRATPVGEVILFIGFGQLLPALVVMFGSLLMFRGHTSGRLIVATGALLAVLLIVVSTLRGDGVLVMNLVMLVVSLAVILLVAMSRYQPPAGQGRTG